MNNNKLIFVESISVSILPEKKRLSDYLPGKFKTITTKSGIKKAIKQNLVKIDGETAFTADFVTGGEKIELFKTCQNKSKKQIDLKIEVAYEDEYLAIVNKPAGIVVSGNKKWTLENALRGCLQISVQRDALTFPEPIHRLDYATSGALLVGKTIKSVNLLNKMFENRQIEKKYHAVTIGEMPSEGIIDTPIDGKPSKSSYLLIDKQISPKYGFLNLAELVPHTGRTHQLRRHLLSIGNPILGDLKYGIDGLILKGKGLYLQSSLLKFTHPFTNQQINVELNLPKKFRKIFDG